MAACVDPFDRSHSFLPQGVDCERRQVHTPASRPMSGARGARRIRRRVQPGRTGRVGCFGENTSVSSIAGFVSRCRAASERSDDARLQCKWRTRDARLHLAAQLKRDRRSSSVQNQGLVKSTYLPPGRYLRRDQVCGLVGVRSYPGRPQVGPPSEVGASAPPVLVLEARAGDFVRANTSEVIIEAFRCPSSLGEQRPAAAARGDRTTACCSPR